jgi:DNA polymerase-3 subunit beta
MITTVADLTSLLGRFHKFAAQNEARLNLSGVCFKEGHIIATDGHRMAYKVDKENVGDDVEAIMPGGFIKKWKTRRKKTDGSVVGLALKKVGTTEYFIIKTGNETCITRKVDAQFPCWQDVVPSGDRESFQFSKNDMADGLKRLSTHLDERYVGVRIKGNTEFPAITVLADNPEMGTRKILMPISKPVDAAFGVNVNYMKDAMSVIESDDVDLYFKDDGSAVELRNADQEDINVIVMPMKV